MSATAPSPSETGQALRTDAVRAIPRPAGARVALRPAGVALAVPGAVGATAELCREPLVSVRAELDAGAQWSALPLDLLVTCLAASALCAGVLWLAAVSIAATVEAVTGLSSGIVRAISPRVVRHLVLACCGVAVSGPALGWPAMAAVGHESQGPETAPASPGPAVAFAGLALPDRATGSLPHPAAGTLQSPDDRRRSDTHRVRPGESLWSIARQLLPGADLTALDTSWRSIYRINRPVIGPDPDLILPGSDLRLPRPASRSAPNRPPGDLGATRHRKDEP